MAGNKFVLKVSFEGPSPVPAAGFIADKSGLSKVRVKDAMNKGAVWIKRRKGPIRRMRRASEPLRPGDELEFYYDADLVALRPAQARCLYDGTEYSVWFKPAGLLSQGTKYGDHCSLTRQAEVFGGRRRQVFIVHRLDREVAGVMLLAHSHQAASKLSLLFQKNLVEKRYRLEVLGDLSQRGRTGTIEIPLDGKESVTKYEVISFHPAANTTLVQAFIVTGRLHQIRRHFDAIGFPVIGDPRYGRGNKNKEGIRLTAVSLKFRCPVKKEKVEFSAYE